MYARTTFRPVSHRQESNTYNTTEDLRTLYTLFNLRELYRTELHVRAKPIVCDEQKRAI